MDTHSLGRDRVVLSTRVFQIWRIVLVVLVVAILGLSGLSIQLYRALMQRHTVAKGETDALQVCRTTLSQYEKHGVACTFPQPVMQALEKQVDHEVENHAQGTSP